MTSNQRNRNEKSTPMAQADVANGEAPDDNDRPDEPTPQAAFDQHGPHPTGKQQAEENRENDPPA